MLVAQLYTILCNPMDCSPPGFSVHGILQARTLEWVVMPSSRRSSFPTQGWNPSCRWILYHLSHQGSPGWFRRCRHRRGRGGGGLSWRHAAGRKRGDTESHLDRCRGLWRGWGGRKGRPYACVTREAGRGGEQVGGRGREDLLTLTASCWLRVPTPAV